jgi:ribosome biogenesis GTPase
VISLENLGWAPYFEAQVTADEQTRLTPARVMAVARGEYRLASEHGEWRGRLAGRLRHAAAAAADLPVVGDWVLIAPGADGAASIRRRLTRRSAITRGVAGRTTAAQVVAANVDTVLLVTSCNQDFNPRRLERYLSLAWEGGARPVVVLNKIDLCSDREPYRAEAASLAPGVPLLAVSARRGDGIDDLRDIVRAGGTTVLLGSSGVGKSTLLNALLGEAHQRTLPVREHDDRGRHSTTARELFCLRDGGIVIDTPGMRELQLWDARAGLEHTFADIEALSAACRFRDCSHRTEPECAVRAAVGAGALTAARLDSYHRLRREDEFVRAREDERARAERTRRAKEVSRAIRAHEKIRRRD